MSEPRSRVPAALDPDPGMSMTPMIDIVFQLIVFFMLTLEFHVPERRLEAALPPVGPAFTPPPRLDDRPPVRVSLFRQDAAVPGKDRTVVRVASEESVALPRDEADRGAALERILATVAAVRDRSGLGADARGEIRTPPPTGALVPHGDVVAVLDVLIRAGIRDVGFQGTPGPR